MTVVAEFNLPAVSGEADEQFSFRQGGLTRNLVVEGRTVEKLTGGGTNHTIRENLTLSYQRVESAPDSASIQDDPPALAPYKSYKVTIEEVP